MEEKWYKISKTEESIDNFLNIFCTLHDYRVYEVNYNYLKDELIIKFVYDTEQEGVLLKFLGVKSISISPEYRIEYPWLAGVGIKITDSGTFLWYDDDEDWSIEEIKESPGRDWVEASEMQFAFLDENGIIVPLTNEKLNPVWMQLNFETMEYEEEQKHFQVEEV